MDMTTTSDNKYELTDARIDEIITRSISRLKFASSSFSSSSLSSQDISSHFPKAAPAPAAAHAPAAPAPAAPAPGNISLYKKYGDGDSDGVDNGVDNDDNDSTATKFFPPATNQLLWCFFIALKGMFAYDTMGNSFVAENAFKYATIDHIRANMQHVKSQFKRYRMPLSNFEAELVTSKVLTPAALLGLALCYDRNILYIDNRKYFEMNATGYLAPAGAVAAADVDLEPLAFTVIEKIKNRFCVLSVAEENAVAFASKMRRLCRDTFWKMDSITSPLKSMSYYTVADLQDIYARLNIGSSKIHIVHAQKKMTKVELYTAIAENI
jgi:hypothetical protein